MGILEGKVAIVTGGAGATSGAAISIALSKEGAAVVVADIDKARAEDVARKIEQMKGTARAVATDVAKSAGVDHMVDETVRTFGAVSILVNAAKIGSAGTLEQIGEEQWDRMMSVRLTGTFHACRAVIPHMRKQGWGRIVSLSSQTAYRSPDPATGMADLAAADAGVVGFSRSLAMEAGPAGITVNVIAPGTVSQIRGGGSIAGDNSLRPDDIAGTVMYLVGPYSGRTSGMVVHMNGGKHFPA